MLKAEEVDLCEAGAKAAALDARARTIPATFMVMFQYIPIIDKRFAFRSVDTNVSGARTEHDDDFPFRPCKTGKEVVDRLPNAT